MVWFTIFIAFFVVIPFMLWQSKAQEKDAAIYYEKQIRDLKWNDDIRRDVQQTLQKEIASLKNDLQRASDMRDTYINLYVEADNKLDEISDYIYENDLQDTPSGKSIIEILEA